MRGVTALLSRRHRRPAQDGPSAADMISSVPEREFPYGQRPECGPDTNAFRKVGPSWKPRPPAPTRPIAVLDGGVPALAKAAGPAGILRQVADGLRNLDQAALDAAKSREGLTYAHTVGAPFHNQLLAAWHSPVRPERRHGEAVRRRAEALAYPSYDAAEAAGRGAYADVMRHADRITGTQGSGVFRPAIAAGGAR